MNRKAYRRGVLGTLAQIALLLVALTPNSVAQAAQEERAGIPKTDKQRLAEAYGKIPLNFERNTGQTSNEVEFLSRGPGYTLFLTRHAEAVMVLGSATTQHASESQTDPLAAVDRPRTESTPPSVFRMKFANAQVTPQAEALEELPGKANYFIGNDPKKWRECADLRPSDFSFRVPRRRFGVLR